MTHEELIELFNDNLERRRKEYGKKWFTMKEYWEIIKKESTV
jgi:hypothetical protein